MNAFVTNYDHNFIIDFKVEIVRIRGGFDNSYTYLYKSISLKIDDKNIFEFSEKFFKMQLENYPFVTRDMKEDNSLLLCNDWTLALKNDDVDSQKKEDFKEDFDYEYYIKSFSNGAKLFYDCHGFFEENNEKKLIGNNFFK